MRMSSNKLWAKNAIQTQMENLVKIFFNVLDWQDVEWAQVTQNILISTEKFSRPKIKYLRRGLKNTDRIYDKECRNEHWFQALLTWKSNAQSAAIGQDKAANAKTVTLQSEKLVSEVDWVF